MFALLKKVSACGVFLLLAASVHLTGAAMDSTGFTVSLLVPENQRNTQGAFDLLTAPGQEQQLTVVLNNRLATSYQCTVEVFTASTGPNGYLAFEKDALFDEGLPCRMEEILTPDRSVIQLDGHGEETLDLTLRMPEKSFKGYMLGTILITRSASAAEIEEAKENGQDYVDEYAMSVGIRLSMADTIIRPDFTIGGVSFSPSGNAPSVLTDLHNPTPGILRGVKVETALYPRDSEVPILSRISDSVSFAPHAVYRIPLGNGEAIPAGDYISTTKVEYNGTVWDFKEELTITDSMLESIPDGEVPLAQPRKAGMGLLLAGITAFLGGAVLLVWVLYPYIQRRIRQKDYELYQKLLRQKQQTQL